MNIDNPVAYILFNSDMDWQSTLVINRRELKRLDGYDGWYLGGEVHSLKEIFSLMENHGFDPEYIYYFFERIPHWIYNALEKNDN